MKVAIIDFEDSFTFNIYSVIKHLSIDVHVLNFKSINFDELASFSHVILGPGPGSTEDYREFFPFVDKLILDALNARIKLVGICLGHQLIHSSLGRDIFPLPQPIHGQSIELNLPDSVFLRSSLRGSRVELQLYNSWAVCSSESSLTFDLEIKGDCEEILASFSQYITTYQFHCESIGTSFQKELFYQFLV